MTTSEARKNSEVVAPPKFFEVDFENKIFLSFTA